MCNRVNPALFSIYRKQIMIMSEIRLKKADVVMLFFVVVSRSEPGFTTIKILAKFSTDCAHVNPSAKERQTRFLSNCTVFTSDKTIKEDIK